MLPAIIGGVAALGGMAAKWHGANQATKNLDKNLDKVAEYMSDYKSGLDSYKPMAEDYMDPTSSYNQSLLSQYRESGMDFAAQQNRMNQRNMYGGGMGGFSGLQNAMGQSASQQAQSQSQDAWTAGLNQSRQTGLFLMDKYLAGQKDYGETMAQGWLQNDQMKRMAQQAKWGGLGDGLLSFAGGLM